MTAFLEKLRAKPKHVRQRIAFFATLFIFFIIANIWWRTWNAGMETRPSTSGVLETPIGVIADLAHRSKVLTKGFITDAVKDAESAASTTGSEYAESVDTANRSDPSRDIVYPEDITNGTTTNHAR